MCQRCGSNMINEGICVKCGEAQFNPYFVPYKKRSCDHAHEQLTYKTQRKYRYKPCINCGRLKWNVGDGLCGACKSQVCSKRNNTYLAKGTEEYTAALVSYREKRWPEKFKTGGYGSTGKGGTSPALPL